MKGRKKSDGCIVPEDHRKVVPTAERRGGKAATVSKRLRQLGLFRETADSPEGDDAGTDLDRSRPVKSAVPKSRTERQQVLPAMKLEEIASEANLGKAFKQVKSNKGAPGVDRQSVDEVKGHWSEIKKQLQRSLQEGTYRPGDIRRVWIPKPGGGQRGLGIPNVVDRIVQQAVLQIMSPHYEETFHPGSHGFRKGRGCHTAIEQAVTYLEEGYEWVVDLDIEKFFDHVNHDRLLARLGKRISDHRVIDLIRMMLKARIVMPDGVVMETEEGTPQGGPLSPLLSNIVLDELDWELARRGHRFVRYADDCNIYVRGERTGKRVMASIVQFLDKKLRLKVNLGKSAVSQPWKRSFLGFRLGYDQTDGTARVLVSRKALKRIQDKIKELTPRNWGGSLSSCIKKVNQYLRGWFGYFGICGQSASTFGALDAHLRRRLRAIILKQCKRKRTIARKLIQLGVSARTAWRGIYKGHRSWWALSHSPAVERGLSNNYFNTIDLYSLKSAWVKKHTPPPEMARRQLELPFG